MSLVDPNPILAAAFILAVIAAIFLPLSLWFEFQRLKESAFERELYEEETRRLGWRLSKRFPQGKDDHTALQLTDPR